MHDRDGAAAGTAAPRPAALDALDEELIIDADVREDLRQGREPFQRIMAARQELPAGGALRVRAIFEPFPLYRVMEKQGLKHFTEHLGPEDWRVWFYEDPHAGAEAGANHPAPTRQAPPAASPDLSSGGVDAEGDVVVLDVRGLEPPEPMVRTLTALETLPDGGTLVQVNVRVPRFLLPHLDERGYAYEIREQEPGLVRVFVWRAS